MNELDVVGFDALYESMLKCKKGVLWKDSVAAFYLRSIERVEKLSKDLQNGTYKASPPKHFMITCPKPREIASIAFRDRVYQRSLNDNVVYPLMTKGFIHDNFACQKGKGTDAARERIKEFLRWHYRRFGVSGYVAQFDTHGYYPNMSHAVAEACFRKYLPDWAYNRVVTILREQYDGDKGYNPGSQLVQIAGISVLSGLDHYIKERLHIHCYLRYMDDLVLIHPDREYLEECKRRITEELSKLDFEVNPKKTRVYPLSDGIMFLGFRFRLTNTGKVLMQINPAKVKAERTKLRRLVRKAKADGIPKESIDMSYASWRNHASKGNSYHLIQRMDKYYNDLWEGSQNESDQSTADNC